MIKCIEHLCPELQSNALGELERLNKTQVEIPIMRRHEDVSAGTILTRCRNTEGLCQINTTRKRDLPLVMRS